MEGRLYGRYEHTIDPKGRIFVPAKMREKLGEGFIAAVLREPCVCLYSLDVWEDELKRVERESQTADPRKAVRALSAAAADVTVDAQGRVLLPKTLLAAAGLADARDALVVGSGDRAEVWHPARYEEVNGAALSDDLKDELRRLGI